MTEAEILAALDTQERKRVEEIKNQIAEIEKTKPPSLPKAMAITDPSPRPPKSYFLHHGSVSSKGTEMGPGALSVLMGSGTEMDFPRPSPNAKTTGRRLALAQWVASDHNPLTARVMVNRIWQHHFGKGIVGTPSNFGRMGDLPTHPELLDWLATEFIRQGYSIKAMHRLILASRTYQQSSNYVNEVNQQKDPENAFLWKFRLRRL